MIQIGIGRHRFSGHELPDATFVSLADVRADTEEPWHKVVVAALLDQKPDTDEAASALVDELIDKVVKAHPRQMSDGLEDQKNLDGLLQKCRPHKDRQMRRS